jgi:hypothetical protein
METPAVPPKPKCPECSTELVLINNELPEKCAKCGFVIEGFGVFERWFKLAMKAWKEGEQPPPPPEIKKKKSILSNLGRR